MTYFSKPLLLSDTYPYGSNSSSGDIARVNSDVGMAGWTYWDEELWFQCIRYSTRTTGPQLTVDMTGVIYAMVNGADDVVWILACDTDVESDTGCALRIGKAVVNPATLAITLTWVAEIEVYWHEGAWFKIWGDRLIVGSNCGNPNDPADPTSRLYSQLYMFDLNGTLLDKKPAPTYLSGATTYTRWVDTMALNPYTNELVMLWNNYVSGSYREYISRMPLSGSTFGTWSEHGYLYLDYARWITGVGTPDGWHFLSCPNAPRYGEVLALDTNLNRRWSHIITPGNGWTSTYYDEEAAKVYDIDYDPSTDTVTYADMYWDNGLTYTRSGVDTPANSAAATQYLPSTTEVSWEGLMRVAHLGGGKTMYLGGARGGLVSTGDYWHAVWLLAEEEGLFPVPLNGQTEGRSNFRRVL